MNKNAFIKYIQLVGYLDKHGPYQMFPDEAYAEAIRIIEKYGEEGIYRAGMQVDGVLGDPDRIRELFASDADFSSTHPGMDLLGWSEMDPESCEDEKELASQFFASN